MPDTGAVPAGASGSDTRAPPCERGGDRNPDACVSQLREGFTSTTIRAVTMRATHETPDKARDEHAAPAGSPFPFVFSGPVAACDRKSGLIGAGLAGAGKPRRRSP
ncbi:hypothetical protein GCM10023205_25560 [Yinghuangia aomiensis]|uniref:Uncharacterized protein n=1 Tax=Yinghuangia aomiensis TaxID=676205 RepID=A0ABP9H414_9ACTN